MKPRDERALTAVYASVVGGGMLYGLYAWHPAAAGVGLSLALIVVRTLHRRGLL